MPQPPGRGRARHRVRLRRLLARHRRSIASALAFLAVLLLAGALKAGDRGRSVLVVTVDLPVGTRLAEGDIGSVSVPTSIVPDGSLTSPSEATGRVLSTPMRSGELLTVTRLVGDALLAGQSPDTVAAPLRLADPTTVRLLRPGDRIDVIAASSSQWADPAATEELLDGASAAASGGPAARIVVEAVAVLTVGSPTSDGSLLSASDAASEGLVVVALTRTQAVDLAAASATDELSFALRSSLDADE